MMLMMSMTIDGNYYTQPDKKKKCVNKSVVLFTRLASCYRARNVHRLDRHRNRGMMIRSIIMATARKGTAHHGARPKSTLPSVRKTGHGKGQPRAASSSGAPMCKDTLVNGLQRLKIGNSTSHIKSLVTTKSRSFSTNSCPKSLADIAKLIRSGQASRIVVCAGAGISTPSGIPDFRTPGTGLYDNLQQYNIPYPEAIFDIEYFCYHPQPFFALAKELYPSVNYFPNYIHYFVKTLHNKGQLLRMYTQNIDGLERLAGIPAEKLVEAHGTFATATCMVCSLKYDGDDIKDAVFNGRLPRCTKHDCTGIVKPDIVFFGEDLPKRFYLYLKDMLLCDLVIVMGTSLEVYPFAGIVDIVPQYVPRVLFNREVVGQFRYNKRDKDVIVEGDLAENIKRFVGKLGMEKDVSEIITAANDKQAWDEKKETAERVDPSSSSKTSSESSQSSAIQGKKNGSTATTGSAPPKRSFHTLPHQLHKFGSSVVNGRLRTSEPRKTGLRPISTKSCPAVKGGKNSSNLRGHVTLGMLTQRKLSGTSVGNAYTSYRTGNNISSSSSGSDDSDDDETDSSENSSDSSEAT